LTDERGDDADAQGAAVIEGLQVRGLERGIRAAVEAEPEDDVGIGVRAGAEVGGAGRSGGCGRRGGRGSERARRCGSCCGGGCFCGWWSGALGGCLLCSSCSCGRGWWGGRSSGGRGWRSGRSSGGRSGCTCPGAGAGASTAYSGSDLVGSDVGNEEILGEDTSNGVIGIIAWGAKVSKTNFISGGSRGRRHVQVFPFPVLSVNKPGAKVPDLMAMVGSPPTLAIWTASSRATALLAAAAPVDAGSWCWLKAAIWGLTALMLVQGLLLVPMPCVLRSRDR
jgi:hypothetical protein